MKQAIRRGLMVLNFSAAWLATLGIIDGGDVDVLFYLLGFLYCFLTLLGSIAFMKPYGRWLFNKPGNISYGIVELIWASALFIWVAGAIGATWASVERFQAVIALGMAYLCVVYLWILPRVRAFSS